MDRVPWDEKKQNSNMNNLDFLHLGLSSQVLTCPQLNLILTHICTCARAYARTCIHTCLHTYRWSSEDLLQPKYQIPPAPTL